MVGVITCVKGAERWDRGFIPEILLTNCSQENKSVPMGHFGSSCFGKGAYLPKYLEGFEAKIRLVKRNSRWGQVVTRRSSSLLEHLAYEGKGTERETWEPLASFNTTPEMGRPSHK